MQAVSLGLFCFAALAGVHDANKSLFIAALCFVMFSFSLGPGPFTTVFANELVPLRHRAKSSAVTCGFRSNSVGFLRLVENRSRARTIESVL